MTVIGQKYFSSYVAQSNYWIIHTKLLTAPFWKTLEEKTLTSLLKHSRIKNYAEKNVLIKQNKLAWDLSESI